MRRWGGPAALAVSLIAGCTGLADLHIPTPPATSANGATTTVTSDLTAVSLTPVSTGTAPTVPLTPGAASLTGVVNGPAGAIAGATVLVERLVGDAAGGKTVATQADGTWRLAGILGGRYRVRAWRPPDLTMITPQILLLGAGATANVTLALTPYNGQSLTATLAPTPPQVGQVSTLVVQATQQSVGGDGVVRAVPLAGATVFVVAAGNVGLAGTNPAITDPSGRMALTLACPTVGPVGLSASVNGVTTFPLTVPDCAPFVPPVTVTPTTLTPATLTPATLTPTTTSVP